MILEPEQHQQLIDFCELVCRNTNALYSFQEPDRVIFTWRGGFVCDTTDQKVFEAIESKFDQEFASQLQKQIFDFKDRVGFDC